MLYGKQKSEQSLRNESSANNTIDEGDKYLTKTFVEARTLTDGVLEAINKVSSLVAKTQEYLDDARLLTENNAPFSEEIETSMRSIFDSLSVMAVRIEEISGATNFVVSQSLAQMMKDLKKYVVELAIEQTRNDSEHKPQK